MATKLDTLSLGHDRAASLSLDPVRFARRYKDPRDKESAAFLAAMLAFGNVKAIGASVEALLEALGPSPARGAREVLLGRRKVPSKLYHRWLGSEDLTALVAAVGRGLARAGSLEALFLEGYDAARHEDIGPALEAFVLALETDLVPRPSLGSACKRPCLFLRWVVRPDDGVDLGLWSGVPASALVAPLDVHVARTARRTGMSRRKTVDWKMAREVTAALREKDPLDPLRFDFDMVYADREEGVKRAASRRRS